MSPSGTIVRWATTIKLALMGGCGSYRNAEGARLTCPSPEGGRCAFDLSLAGRCAGSLETGTLGRVGARLCESAVFSFEVGLSGGK
jgi:hypothetical protein